MTWKSVDCAPEASAPAHRVTSRIPAHMAAPAHGRLTHGAGTVPAHVPGGTDTSSGIPADPGRRGCGSAAL
jgi:hypothetical protein